MNEVRFKWLTGRLRKFAVHNPWAVDRWLEEIAIETDEEQWTRAGRVLGHLPFFKTASLAVRDPVEASKGET